MTPSPLPPLRVRRAVPGDAAGIAGLAAACALGPGTDPAGGFLVSGWDRARYARLLAAGADGWAVEDADGPDGLVGFAVAVPAAADPDALAGPEDLRPELVVAQVAVAARARRRGAATLLYRAVLAEHGLVRVGAGIVERPRNDASIAFHRRLGFVRVGSLPVRSDGLEGGLWVRPAGPVSCGA